MGREVRKAQKINDAGALFAILRPIFAGLTENAQDHPGDLRLCLIFRQFDQNDYNSAWREIETNMAVWQVQEAKTRLSEVMEEANSKGPQFITRHGSERAVIRSVKDYRALTAHKPDLREYLLGGPKVDRFKVPRSRDKGRKATL
jgi:antitoxin Phd